MVGRVGSVQQVVGGHNRHGLACFYRNFKTLQIDFPQRPFTDMGVGKHPVILLAVRCKMLDCRSDPGPGLHALCVRGSTHSGEQRVLGIVFKIPAAQRVSVDIHAGSQPERHMEILPFLCRRFCPLFQSAPYPRTGPAGWRRESPYNTGNNPPHPPSAPDPLPWEFRWIVSPLTSSLPSAVVAK